MENNQPQSLLIKGNRWEIYQHLQWMNGRDYFFLERTSDVDIFNLQVRWMFRPSTPNMAILIGAIRILDEGDNTRILFIVLASGEKMISEPFQKFFETVRDYFQESVISEDNAWKPSGWERVDRNIVKVRQVLSTAIDEEDFQTVGLLCREAIISLAQAVYKHDLHGSLEGIKISETDAKRMIENFIFTELAGESNEETRKYARDCYQLAVSLQHKRSANYTESALCVEATRSLVSIIAIIAEQKKSSENKPP